MLTIQDLSYTHENGDLLFSNISLVVNNHEKMALIGNNGVGKSTLLKIIAGAIQPTGGSIKVDSAAYFIPQIFGQYNHLSIAEALGIEAKLTALHNILNGNTSEENFRLLDDDWTIEDRCDEALRYWGLSGLDLSLKMKTLSGGQRTKVFLSGIAIHQPELVLMDEPTNHIDALGRQILYDFITKTNRTLIIVSHDRKLLTLLDTIAEMSPHGIRMYGGNYDFYKAQKEIETNALNQDILSKEKTFKKAKEKERQTLDRQQKLDARAKKNVGKAGLPKIVSNTWKNNAERSTAKMKDVHADKTAHIRQELQTLRASLSATDQIRFGFDNAALYQGKTLFAATDINFSYGGDKYIWKKGLSFRIASGERLAITGPNGSGKTTLLNVILGKLMPQSGSVSVAESKSVYIDQDYSLIDNDLSVYEQAQQFNTTALQEHEIKIRLNRFLFTQDDWDKSCAMLSGGERMRLILCCLSIANQSPDIIILDEPTNNLDIQNIEILTKVINGYQGTVVVISHDEIFMEQLKIERRIML
jgi:ATPase subunit of ABC transporter with duplicated ATPase domains